MKCDGCSLKKEDFYTDEYGKQFCRECMAKALEING